MKKLLILVCALSTTAFGAAGLKFTDLSIEAQIAKYREIYDEAYKTTQEKGYTILDNVQTQHIPGLSNILTDAIDMVKNTQKSHDTTAKLDKLLAEISDYEEKQNMTQAAFIYLNTSLAIIADYDNTGTSQIQALKKPSKIKYYDPHLQKEVSTLIHSIKHKEPSTVFDTVFYPPMIIYSNQSISSEEFNKQSFEYEYPSFIMQFDLTIKTDDKSEEYLQTRPHWGIYNTTYKMLNHDLTHLREQFTWEHLFNSYHADKLNLKGKLKELYSKSKTLKDENKQKIISNAIFVFSHELRILSATRQTLTTELYDNPTFAHVIDITKDKFMSFAFNGFQYTRNYESMIQIPCRKYQEYRQAFIDMEFVFKDVTDADGNPLVEPFDGTENDVETINKGYERFWDMFKQIVKDMDLL